jgi:hypothetical protein
VLGHRAKPERWLDIGYVELHLIELVQEIVWKVAWCLVDLVDQDHRRGRRTDRFAEGAVREVLAGVFALASPWRRRETGSEST